MSEEPVVGLGKGGAEVRRRPPAQRQQPAGVEDLARRAVGLARVEEESSAVIDDLRQQLCRIGDRTLRATTQSDDRVTIVMPQHAPAGIGKIADVEDLPPHPAAAPDGDDLLTAELRCGHAPHQGWQEVARLSAEVVEGAEHVGWYGGDEQRTM